MKKSTASTSSRQSLTLNGNTSNRDYINDKVFGLPKPKRKGHCTSPSKIKGTEYIYTMKSELTGKETFRVALHRGNTFKCKTFKDFDTAKTYVEMLRINKYF